MGRAIGEILPLAVGVAISPLPIIAVILMLVSERVRENSLGLLLGWILGLVVVGAVVLAIGGGSFGRESTGSGVAKLVFGVILLLLAVRRWRGRNAEGTPRMQKLLAKIDQLTAAKSFGLGAVLSGLNPKNLALTAAAALSISAAGLSVGAEIGTLAIFIAIGTCTLAAPVLMYLALGKRADPLLERVRGWLLAHNAAIAIVLLVVFGAKLTGDGIAILA